MTEPIPYVDAMDWRADFHALRHTLGGVKGSGGQAVICVSDQALAPWADLGYLEWFMNDELLNSTPSFTPRRPLEERLTHRPAVLARLHQLADTLEQSVGDDCTADQAEGRVSEQMRQHRRNGRPPR